MSKRRSYRKRTAFLTALALVLLFGTTLQDSLAYFTTYTIARGHWPVVFGPDTDIEEKIEDLTKKIQIENTGETDCFVRVRAYFGEDMVALKEVGEEDAKDGVIHWTQDGDWWYYSQVLKPGEKTCELAMTFAPTKELNLDPVIDTFHVIIVQETAPVLYRQDSDGTRTPYADWSTEKQTGQNEEAGS